MSGVSSGFWKRFQSDPSVDVNQMFTANPGSVKEMARAQPERFSLDASV
jgi:hypothetical protein